MSQAVPVDPELPLLDSPSLPELVLAPELVDELPPELLVSVSPGSVVTAGCVVKLDDASLDGLQASKPASARMGRTGDTTDEGSAGPRVRQAPARHSRNGRYLETQPIPQQSKEVILVRILQVSPSERACPRAA